MNKKTSQLAFLFLLSAGLFCSVAPALAVRDAHTEVELISEVESIKPANGFWVGVRFKMDPGWHIYWKNPGDSGLATQIEWHLPEGFSAGPILWPYPQKIGEPPWVSYGYEGEVLLMSEIEPPASPSGSQTLSLEAQVKWLACEKSCIPGRAKVVLQLPVSREEPKPAARGTEDFSNARARLPLPAADWKIKVTDSKKNFLIHFDPPAPAGAPLEGVYFFPEKPDLIQHAARQKCIRTPGGGYRLEVPKASALARVPGRIRGVLVASEGGRGTNSEKAFEIDQGIE